MIQESDVERRNLMVMSWSIIIYNFADGTFGNTLKLPLTSIEFTNTKALIYIAWFMLFWFSIRFWQKHRLSFIYQIEQHISSNHSKEFIYKCLENELGKEMMEKDRMVMNPSYFRRNKSIVYMTLDTESQFKNNTIEKEINMEGLGFTIFRVKNNLSAYVNSNGITSYLMPYVFALLAVASPFISKYFI